MREYSPRSYSSAMILFWSIMGAFLLQQIDLRYNYGGMHRYLVLSLPGIKHGYLWEFFTFQFLHSGWFHLFFNLFALWSFGRGLEQILGTRQFLISYFLSGAVGGALQLVFGMIGPGVWGSATMGASAGICGMMAIFATIDPHSTISVWGMPFRARPFMIGMAALSVFFILVPVDATAHAAHLGGILFGVAYAKWFMHADWSGFTAKFRRATPKPRELVTAPAGPFWKKPGKPMPPEEDIPSGDFISKEVDPILDKISAHGIQSLTERERRILEAARAKMSKR